MFLVPITCHEKEILVFVLPLGEKNGQVKEEGRRERERERDKRKEEGLSFTSVA